MGPKDIYSSYVRMLVQDRPGVWAADLPPLSVTTKSARRPLCKNAPWGNLAEIVVITHGVSEYALRKAEKALSNLECGLPDL